MDKPLLGSGNGVSAGGYLWFVRRCLSINSKCMAHTEASRPADLLAKGISHREQLYSDFIGESTRAMADATQHTFEDPSRLVPIYGLISRIRLSSPTSVVESAERVANTILTTYSAPNLTAEEIQARAVKGDDPLREFSSICRRELESMKSGL